MKTLYFDCFAGIAGDMLVGALFELVPNQDRFKAELAKMTKLSPKDYDVGFEKGSKNGITGTIPSKIPKIAVETILIMLRTGFSDFSELSCSELLCLRRKISNKTSSAINPIK